MTDSKSKEEADESSKAREDADSPPDDDDDEVADTEVDLEANVTTGSGEGKQEDVDEDGNDKPVKDETSLEQHEPSALAGDDEASDDGDEGAPEDDQPSVVESATEEKPVTRIVDRVPSDDRKERSGRKSGAAPVAMPRRTSQEEEEKVPEDELVRREMEGEAATTPELAGIEKMTVATPDPASKPPDEEMEITFYREGEDQQQPKIDAKPGIDEDDESAGGDEDERAARRRCRIICLASLLGLMVAAFAIGIGIGFALRPPGSRSAANADFSKSIDNAEECKSDSVCRFILSVLESSHPASTWERLFDQGSCQNEAMNWIRRTFTDATFSIPELSIVQRYALAVFYCDLGGQDWLSESDTWLTDEHECDWHTLPKYQTGACDTLKQFKTISLSGQNLRGTLPPELSMISGLYDVDLSNNFIIGRVPFEYGKLSQLETVNMSKNELGGTLPGVVWDGFYLREMDFSCNAFFGTIPADQYAQAPNLVVVRLGNNNIRGRLPSDLGNYDWKVLDLHNNQLQGTIPVSINSKRLEELLLHNNPFLTGTFPTDDFVGSFAPVDPTLSRLRRLSLYGTGVTGSLGNLCDLMSVGNLEYLGIDEEERSSCTCCNTTRLDDSQCSSASAPAGTSRPTAAPTRLFSLPSIFRLPKNEVDAACSLGAFDSDGGITCRSLCLPHYSDCCQPFEDDTIYTGDPIGSCTFDENLQGCISYSKCHAATSSRDPAAATLPVYCTEPRLSADRETCEDLCRYRECCFNPPDSNHCRADLFELCLDYAPCQNLRDGVVLETAPPDLDDLCFFDRPDCALYCERAACCSVTHPNSCFQDNFISCLTYAACNLSSSSGLTLTVTPKFSVVPVLPAGIRNVCFAASSFDVCRTMCESAACCFAGDPSANCFNRDPLGCTLWLEHCQLVI